MNYVNTEIPDVSAKLPLASDRLIRGDDEAALRRTNLLMGELFVAALGVDHEMRSSGTQAWISLCRTISFGMALDLLELCRLRELGLRDDRNDPHFTEDKISALVRQVNDIAKY